MNVSLPFLKAIDQVKQCRKDEDTSDQQCPSQRLDRLIMASVLQ